MSRTESTEIHVESAVGRKVNWADATIQLRGAASVDEADDLVDALTEAVFNGDALPEATPFLTLAVRQASSDLSLRSTALALAVAAPADDNEAVNILVEVYGRKAHHPFLVPSLLEAIGLLAHRNALARAQVHVLLLRLNANDSRYLLVKAAQVIGRLNAIKAEPDLRAKLDEFLGCDDAAVQAEARQQLALAELADVLQAEDEPTFRARLISAGAAFARAEMSEEHRPDASMFVKLIDALVAFFRLARSRSDSEAALVEPAETLRHSLTSLATHDWHGYRSERATLLALHVLGIVDGLRRAAATVGTAEEWTNLAAALETLARLHAQVRGQSLSDSQDRVVFAMGSFADTVFAASLGPLLARVVQQRRLARITADYVLSHGEDDVARGLRALEQAAATSTFAADPALSEATAGHLVEVAAKVGRAPDVLLSEVLEALQQHRITSWAEEVGLTPGMLPVEQLELYGGDHSVDEVVRPLLHQLADQLGDFQLPKWLRLVEVLVSVVKFVHFVRDRMPAYTVCEEDGGLGQRASENDLQDHVFEWLRLNFGQQAVYELARTGGGRPDTGVVFPEVRFPFEVKHEFQSISLEHLRSNLVGQPDVYAAVTDRVSFLLVLDLRAANAAGHRARKKAARKSGSKPTVSGLYHLRDSFRLEVLPADPDLPDSTSKVVIIALVPGNRPQPSSLSTYSKRPQSARRYRRTPLASDERA